MTPENKAVLQMELRRDEDVRRNMYLDSKGIPTIGIGHNMRAEPLPNGWVQPLTDAQITILFQNDLQTKAIAPLDRSCPWWSAMDDVRQRVIANMCFNMGWGTLSTFVNTLADMKAGNYDAAADGMKASAWYGQVGQRAVRLVEMMRTGVTAE
jgi:lysozyme